MQAMSACSFGRAGARCVRPYQELEAHCDESGERFPLLAMRLACAALTRALQPLALCAPAARHPWRGDPLTVRFLRCGLCRLCGFMDTGTLRPACAPSLAR